MPQAPFLIDQIQIEPGSAGTRMIKRDSSTGGLNLSDAVVTGGLNLAQLAGLRNITGTLVVGKAGAGAQYTTVQAAIDAVPSNSSALAPWVILICPGTYLETLNITKNGVHLIGLGGVTLSSLSENTPDGGGAYHTIVVQAANGTIPKTVTLRNLTITNAHANFACVRIVGALNSHVGEDAVRLVDCDLTGTGKILWATSSNRIIIERGSWKGSGTSALALITDCASLDLVSVSDIPAVQADYSSVSAALPYLSGSLYRIVNCPNVGVSSVVSPPVVSTLVGAGSLLIASCPNMQAVTVAGDRTVSIVSSSIGNLVLGSTTAATLVGSSRGTASGATATLAESAQRGSMAFVAAATHAVTFTVPQPDSNYIVGFETDGTISAYGPWVTNKSSTGFTINFSAVQTLVVLWTALRTTGTAANG